MKNSNKNRFLYILVTVVSVVLSISIFCSCSFDVDLAEGADAGAVSTVNSLETSSESVDSSSETNSDNNVLTSYGYNNLSSDKLKELYVLIDEYAASASSKDISVEYNLSEKDLSETIEAYKNDHPEVFWLKSKFSYLNDDGNTYLTLEYNVDALKLDEEKSNFNQELQKAVDGAPENASYYELEIYAHDYITKNCVYNEEAAKQKDSIENSNDAYGVFVRKTAVCEGYARAFQLLCNKFGIDCVNISGEGEGELHQWNCVKLDNEWYEVDVTWDDVDEKNMDTLYFCYNLNSEEFSQTHKANRLYKDISVQEYKDADRYFNLYVPKCTGEKYNYFRYNKCETLYDINSADKITDAIAKAAKDKEKTFNFFVDNSLDFNSTYDKILNDGYMYEWISNANNQNNNSPELNEECNVYSDESIRVVTVQLAYK